MGGKATGSLLMIVMVVVNDGEEEEEEEGVSVMAPLKHRFIMFTVNVSTLSAYKECYVPPTGNSPVLICEISSLWHWNTWAECLSLTHPSNPFFYLPKDFSSILKDYTTGVTITQ
ncbi:hypothetical protein M0804_009209 [Polistes exclamans]|nr:hypothetical protein M0804_009209 [Polistes exclamans]